MNMYNWYVHEAICQLEGFDKNLLVDLKLKVLIQTLNKVQEICANIHILLN